MLNLNLINDPTRQFKKIENSISLYPYDGRAPNLIDKFYIFGYNYLTLKKYLIDENPKISGEINNQTLYSFKLEENPSTLAEITNNFKKEIIDTQTIQNLLFPNKLDIFYGLDDEIKPPMMHRLSVQNINFNNKEQDKNGFNKIDLSYNNTGCPKSRRVIFTCNPIEMGTNVKKIQNGFAYTFYRKFLKKKEIGNKNIIFYVPYTFCIVSEFPFFKSYEALFRCIRKMYSQDLIYIPIEILLYKIIILTPSPINNDVILDLEQMCNHVKALKNYMQESEVNKRADTSKTNNKFYKYGFNLKSKNRIYENDFLVMEKNDFKPKVKKANNATNIYEYKIKFNYLSGYPLIQYNLAKVLFNTLSTEDIINTFLFTFLEVNVIFFSKDIEYLTFTINAYMNFNYPYNDSQYFFNLGAISLEGFQFGDKFGEKNFSSIIAINNGYVENYLSKLNRLGDHIVVDLDNGKVMSGKYDKIAQLIKNICYENSDYENFEDTTIYKAISNLKKRLDKALEKKNIYFNLDFIDFNEGNNKDNIKELNISIQEAFYECVINLCLYCYENFIITEEEREVHKKKENINLMKIEFNENCLKEGLYTEEESLVLRELMDTMKFKGSFCQFVLDHNPIDLYKIPLTFTDEFILFISRKRAEIDTSKIQFFKIIEELYLSKKINETKEFNFITDINKFLNNFKNKFFREIEERNEKKYNPDNSSIIKVINNIYQDEEENNKILKYQTYELDNKILLNYVNIISNLTEGKYLELISDNFATEENIINEIDITEIETRVEKYCLDKKYITNNELCGVNILIIFSISLKFLPEYMNNYSFLKELFENFIIFRKYYSFLLQMTYKIYKQSLVENNYNKNKQMEICFFSCLNFIRNEKIVPNENLMLIINKFLKLFFEVKKDDKKQEINNNNILKNFKADESKKNIINKNLFITYNFSSVRFYKEEELLDMVYQNQKQSFKVDDKEEMLPKIRYIIDNNEKEESLIFSQKQILNTLINEYNKFLENLDMKIMDRKNILDSCLNIFIFMRNDEKYSNLKEIWNTMEFIFYIFLNNQ